MNCIIPLTLISVNVLAECTVTEPVPVEPTEQSSVVLMAEYWPRTNKTEILRKANGTLYSKVITRDHNLIDTENHHPETPSDKIVSRSYFYNIGYAQPIYYTEMVFSLGVNGHVTELGGLPHQDRANNPSTTWKGTHTTSYTWQGISTGLNWGEDGGNSVESGWTKTRMGSVIYGERGYTVSNIGLTYSRMRVLETFDEYQPEYGRSDEGDWGKGNGQTYNDVVRIQFQHGTKYGYNTTACPGAEAFHVPGYSTIVVEMWLDREGTVIKEDTVLSESWESSCIGSHNYADKASRAQYIDVM